ncbi:hypothetical protein HZH68_008680 [Vespula germanica]|uniref:Uncharacterized protein n=1 Tax=Vespula germanica TaxID=30212 RepID=A0A834N7Q0_VESGE|nr:hypothetical protein HZH68_008680 [Vespula germanica]
MKSGRGVEVKWVEGQNGSRVNGSAQGSTRCSVLLRGTSFYKVLRKWQAHLSVPKNVDEGSLWSPFVQ